MNVRNAGLRRLVAVAAGLAAGLAGFSAPGDALAQIALTRHNLGTTPGGTGVNQFSGTAEICVFPHAARRGHGRGSPAVEPRAAGGLVVPDL